MNINWKQKLTSRKLWIAFAGMAAGFALAFGAAAETAETISGCILSVASVIGYLVGEGLVDARRAAAQAQDGTAAGDTHPVGYRDAWDEGCDSLLGGSDGHDDFVGEEG